jgi:AcrR family transcriptional regulator
MPRRVDHDARRREILTAALEILGEGGPSALSFRTVAARLGGSATLVTHYYPARQQMMEELVAFTVDRWKDELAALETGVEEPRRRLRILLEWLVPADEEGLREERGRINLLAEHWDDPETRLLLKEWDGYMRHLVRRHLEPLVPAAKLEKTVDILRVTTNGITLSTIEHPDQWPSRRQMGVLDDQLDILGLAAEQQPV